VKASSGSATLGLPTYTIARVVPQVHGLLQIWRFSSDVTVTGRYLASTENTVVQLPNHSLVLKQLSGWKGYGVMTNSFNLDPAGHFALTASYKNGFNAPKFQRVNTVLGGILVRY
jgi:hypothetical protein